MPIKVDYAVQESVTNMRRNLFMTFAAILVVAVSLFLAGAALLVQRATNRASALFTHQVEVAVFLTPDISSDERGQLQRDLLAMPEVESVIYESKPDAYQRFRRLFANQPDIVNNTSPDALPESFRVKLKDPHQFGVIRDRLQGRPGILQIRDERQVVHDLFKATDTQRKVAYATAGVVFAAALVLIATTIRMAIYARRKEIGIMKLVGATNWFIRIPFMMEGVVEGLIGAIVAVLLLLPTKSVLSSFGPGGLLLRVKFNVTFGDVATYGIYL
ncbi:MAG: permease-like cell division protein FtsX, partial [Actinomycetota bacterium]